MIKKIYYHFKRLKLLDTSKHIILPRDTFYFTLNDVEKAQAGCIYAEKGRISYTFIPTEIGQIVKVTVLSTGQTFDVTDYTQII